MKWSTFFTVGLLLTAMSTTGCKTMEFAGPNWFNQTDKPRLRIPSPFKAKEPESEFKTPQKMAVIWKDSVRQEPGQPPTRGFGGRVYFYDAENKSVKVDGEMIVYGLDDDADSTDPDRKKKFVFEQKLLQRHYGETELGHSYSFWVPWEQVGGSHKSITLLPFFKGAEGKLVKGGQTVNLLPGTGPDERVAEKKASAYKNNIRLASANGDKTRVALASGRENASGIRETTIRLPKHLGNRVGKLPSTTGPYNTIRERQEVIAIEDSSTDLRDKESPNQSEAQTRVATENGLRTQQSRPAFGRPGPFR